MTEHASMDDLRQERAGRPSFNADEYNAGREEAKLAIEFANAIRERRLELGLTCWIRRSMRWQHSPIDTWDWSEWCR